VKGMIDRAHVPVGLLRTLAIAAALLALSGPARAAEITVFAAGGGPGEAWKRGWGGAFTITFFDLVHGELEGMKLGSDVPETSLVSGTAKAYFGPTFGRLVPYLGLGAGVYHWGLEANDENSSFSEVIAGLKVKLPLGIVLRGEFQWVSIGDDTVIALDHRVIVGAGLRF
jgi:hypothetical protein